MPDDAKHETRERARDWLDLLAGTEAGGSGSGADGMILMPVLSGSMRPDVPVDAVIGIQPDLRDRTRDGDLVVFRRNDKLTVHRRLLAVTVGPLAGLYQKGDAVASGGWIDPTEIVGVVVEIRLPDGTRVDLKRPETRARALRRARRSLVADLKHRLRSVLRIGSTPR